MPWTTGEQIYLGILCISLIACILASGFLVSKSKSCYAHIVSQEIFVLDTQGTNVEPNFKRNYKQIDQNVGKHTYKNDMTNINLSPKSWNDLANYIVNLADYDAIIIILSRENLLYTAVALSFIIENNNKPIILSSDSISAPLEKISSVQFPEVMIYDNGKLLRANRVQIDKNKLISTYPALTMDNTFPKPADMQNLKFFSTKVSVALVKKDITQSILALPDTTQGIVIKSPNVNVDKTLLDVLKKIGKQGIAIVLTSDDPTISEIDPELTAAGILNGCGMTPTTAYIKLLFLLSHVPQRKLIGQIMDMDLRGEINPPPSAKK
jgi:L-asparaginase/Glu-tRNA(Gln) amidotransferase subunit D